MAAFPLGAGLKPGNQRQGLIPALKRCATQEQSPKAGGAKTAAARRGQLLALIAHEDYVGIVVSADESELAAVKGVVEVRNVFRFESGDLFGR
jgi:hypothetical protein